MLTAHLLVVLLSQTPDPLLGDVGESCRARADCRSGLKCINSQCTAPAPQGKEGQACEATPDCSSDGALRCIAQICSKPRGASGQSTSGASLTPPPPPPSAPSASASSARLTQEPAPGPRAATLVAQEPPLIPNREVGLSVSQQVLQLETEIDSINTQLRAVQTGWPGGSIALVVIGAVLSPAALAGLIMLVVPLVGIPVLLVGLGGIAMIVGGASGGMRVSAEAVAEREALVQKRELAERELNNLRRMGSLTPRAEASMMTLAAF